MTLKTPSNHTVVVSSSQDPIKFPIISFLPCCNEEGKLQRHKIEQGSDFPKSITLTCLSCGITHLDLPFHNETGIKGLDESLI